jgi:Domain of unknown function (DUF4352)
MDATAEKFPIHWQRLIIVVASIVGFSSLFLPWIYSPIGRTGLIGVTHLALPEPSQAFKDARKAADNAGPGEETIMMNSLLRRAAEKEDESLKNAAFVANVMIDYRVFLCWIIAALFALPLIIALIGAKAAPLPSTARTIVAVPSAFAAALVFLFGLAVLLTHQKWFSLGIGPFVSFVAGITIIGSAPWKRPAPRTIALFFGKIGIVGMVVLLIIVTKNWKPSTPEDQTTQKTSLNLSPTPDEGTPDAGSYRVRLNEQFSLGNYSYKITSVRVAKALGSEFDRQRASDGAIYFVVNFLIRNDGKQTEETDPNDFRLRDGQSREFSPDSRATMTVSSDFILRELHPGVFKKAAVAFEVPEEVIKTNFKIVIPEKGLFKENRKTAVLSLAPAH